MRTIVLAVVLTFLGFTNVFAQNTLASLPQEAQAIKMKKKKLRSDRFRAPTFKAGNFSLSKYVQRNLHYPTLALENSREGIVIVEFIIELDGKVTDATIVQSLGLGCDEVVLELIHRMPNWRPAKRGGVPFAMKMRLPIVFRLQ